MEELQFFFYKTILEVSDTHVVPLYALTLKLPLIIKHNLFIYVLKVEEK